MACWQFNNNEAFMTILSHIGAFFSTIWHVLDWLRRMTANILFIALR